MYIVFALNIEIRIEEENTGELLKVKQFSIRTNTVVIIGHCWAGVNLHIWGFTTEWLCKGCKEKDKTIKQLLCFCPGLAEHSATGKKILRKVIEM